MYKDYYYKTRDLNDHVFTFYSVLISEEYSGKKQSWKWLIHFLRVKYKTKRSDRSEDNNGDNAVTPSGYACDNDSGALPLSFPTLLNIPFPLTTINNQQTKPQCSRMSQKFHF